MRRRTKWIAGIVVVLVAGGVVARNVAQRAKRGVEVRVEAVGTRDLVAAVTASGQVQPQTKANLSADITGRITQLDVREGDLVREGQFLLQIDPQQFEAAVQRAEATLASSRAEQAQSRANLLQSTRNLERLEELARTGHVSEEQLEQARTAREVGEALLEAAEYRVRQAEAGLRDAQLQLERTTIRAPMNGRVTRLNVEVGETAIQGTMNRDAAVLLTISDMSVLQTRVRVDETDVVRIKPGDSATVQLDAFPDTTFLGRVVQVSSSAFRTTTSPQGDQAVDYEVLIQLLNAPADTRPDLSATARIITDTRMQVLSIPIIALTVREDSAFAANDRPVAVGGRPPPAQVGRRDIEGVFVLGEDNKVTFRPVRVGIAGDRYFEVVSGLEGGERIVAGTYQAIRELRDGMVVREAGTAPVAATTRGSN